MARWLDTVGKALSNAVRADSWFNLMSGVGGVNSRAQMSFGVQRAEYLSLVDHENLYNYDGVAARIVDSVPSHALRQGFTISTGEAEVETALLDAMVSLNALELVKRAWTWGRLFGGAVIYVGADDGGTPDEPLDESALRCVRWLKVVSRRYVYPVEWERDPNRANFGEPTVYQVTRLGGTQAQTMRVHASRLIRFEGNDPTETRRLQLQGWGDSVLQRCYQELMAARGAFAASGELVQQASQGVLKLKGLADMLSSDTDDKVKRRLYLMDLSRSVARSMLIDSDGEDFTRADVGSLTGVADIMDRMVNMLAAVTGIPVTVLMGQAPAGLNATGDSDIRNWYDALNSERETVLRSRLNRLVHLVLVSREGPTGGEEPDGWRVVLPSLWQPTPVEEMDIRVKQAGVDQIYNTIQVLTPEEIAVSRFRKEGYSTDTSIDLDVRAAMIEADKAGATSDPADDTDDAPGADHASGVAGVIAQVAARELPRDSGIALLVASFGMDAAAAEAVMGEAGRTFFTAPEPGHAAEMDSMRGEVAKLRASNAGHQQYTARVIQLAKNGGLELGAFASGAPTATEEGDDLEPGDVVLTKVDAADGVPVAIVFPLPTGAAAHVAIEGGEPAAELHLTADFLGRRVLADEEASRIVEVLKAWAADRAPLPVRLGVVGRFIGKDPAKGDPIYRSVTGVDLMTERASLVKALADAGFPTSTEHAYVAHVTIAYIPTGARSPLARTEPMEVMLDRVALWAGERRVEVMLTGGM